MRGSHRSTILKISDENLNRFWVSNCEEQTRKCLGGVVKPQFKYLALNYVSNEDIIAKGIAHAAEAWQKISDKSCTYLQCIAMGFMLNKEDSERG